MATVMVVIVGVVVALFVVAMIVTEPGPVQLDPVSAIPCGDVDVTGESVTVSWSANDRECRYQVRLAALDVCFTADQVNDTERNGWAVHCGGVTFREFSPVSGQLRAVFTVDSP